jgi:hypothetical protein
METELVGLKSKCSFLADLFSFLEFTNEYNSSFKPTSVLKEEVWRVIEQHKSENEEVSYICQNK